MILLDTNICIYIMNNSHVEILSELAKYGINDVAISAHTLAELYYGAENSARKEHNLSVINRFISRIGVLNFGAKEATAYAKVRIEMKLKNRNIGDMNMLIAATALANGYTLITNNEKDFREISGLKIENWAKN